MDPNGLQAVGKGVSLLPCRKIVYRLRFAAPPFFLGFATFALLVFLAGAAGLRRGRLEVAEGVALLFVPVILSAARWKAVSALPAASSTAPATPWAVFRAQS